MKIIVDAFGGDNAPQEIIKGAAQAVSEYGHHVLLTGDEEIIRRVAADVGVLLDGIEIVHANGAIPMEAHPKSILREYKDCSMAVALRLLSEGQGDALVSAGSTGALLMGATFIVKRIKGVSRPALAPILPSGKDPFMLIDSGANVECRPEMLLQFAYMGSIYMSRMMPDAAAPRVGLLNVGTEDTKGGELQQSAFTLLKESGLNFIGNVEARDVPAGIADVVVADGFSGNILLKTIEGTADMIISILKAGLTASVRTKLGALLVMPAMKALKKKMSTSEYGGAVLLGVNRPVVKAHGNSGAKAIAKAIHVAAEFASAGVVEDIAAAVAKTADDEKTEVNT